MEFQILLAFLVLLNVNGQESFFGYKNYTTYITGNFNLMISIPHDGKLKPSDVPDRGSDVVSDFNTQKMGLAIQDELLKLFRLENKRPFLVINNLHRVKLDPNRDTDECCTGTDNDGYRAYLDYHNFIKKFEHEFMELNAKGYRQGLLIDLHGQSHVEQWIELGYLLTKPELDKSVLMAPRLSSIRLLHSNSSHSFEKLIRGAVSLGGILELDHGLKTVPSPMNKSPGTGNYYTGGFTTRTYGSIDCKRSRLNAIQIEMPYYTRQDDVNALKYSKILAKAIYDYYHLHDFDQLLSSTQKEVEIEEMLKRCRIN